MSTTYSNYYANSEMNTKHTIRKKAQDFFIRLIAKTQERERELINYLRHTDLLIKIISFYRDKSLGIIKFYQMSLNIEYLVI